jgi:HD superfamily phosphodiesterase
MELELKLLDFVKKICKDRDESHNHVHMEKVSQLSKIIYSKLTDELKNEEVYNLVVIVAWLHDVCDHKYDKDNTLRSKVKSFLLRISNETDLILAIIDRVSYSKENSAREKNTPLDWKEKLGDVGCFVRNVVSDADKLDAIGKNGVIRCKKFAKIHYKEKYNINPPYDILIHLILNHAEEKLLRLKDEFIRTTVGKELAVPLHNEMILELENLKFIRIDKLYKIAPALNIEGGLPYLDLIKSNNKAVWSNIIFVLDRPIIDNISFSDVMNTVVKNDYPLLENAISEFNEHQMLATILLTMIYYIENAKSIVNKPKVNILIHIHQDTIAQNLISIIKEHLKILSNIQNVNLTYDTDHNTYINTGHNFENIDILLSFSQACGLDVKFKPGAALIADTFIPFDTVNKSVDIDKQYKVDNDILVRMNDIVTSEYNKLVCDHLNKYYISSNKNKSHMVNIVEPFTKCRIFQVKDIWNPDKFDANVKIVIK